MVRLLLLLYLAIGAIWPIGCKAFQGYVHSARHFRFGTVDEVQVGKPAGRVIENLRRTLAMRDIGIISVETEQEATQMRASKDGLTYVFDVVELGEEATLVRLEIDQAGNNGEIWSLLNDVKAMP